MNLKELVKKHFNLVDNLVDDGPVEDEQIMSEVKTADGQLTLVYEGDEYAVGTPIFVRTEDGDIPAPDGDHALEGNVVITTADGRITSIEKNGEPEQAAEVAMEEETTPMDEVIEKLVEELIDELKPIMDEMKKDIEEMKSKFASMDKKVETFSKEPAAVKAKEEIYSKRKSAAKNEDFRNDEHKKVFERIMKRNKK
jgi:hypothetical protein